MRLLGKTFVIVVIAVVMFGIAAPAQAITMKDSADFENKFEGDTSGTPADYTEMVQVFDTASSDGNIFTLQDLEGDAIYESNSWATEAEDANGWTLEVRLKIDAADKGQAIRFGDAENDPNNPQNFLFFRADKVTSNFGGSDVVASMDTTDDFHIYRVAEEAGSETTRVWIDGVEIAHTFNESAFATPQNQVNMWFGAGGGGFNGIGEWDYVRWTGEGGFAPIPEPATWVLLTLGAVGFALAAWRRRRTR